MRNSIIIAWLCAGLLALGQSFTPTDVAWVGAVVSEVGGCSSDATDIPHDEFVEGFEAPGYENLGSWANWVEGAGGSTLDESYDISGLTTGKPDHSCSYGLRHVTKTDGTEDGTRRDYGSTIATNTVVDICVYIYVETLPPDTKRVGVLNVNNSTTPYVAGNKVQLYNNGGTAQVRPAGASTGAYKNLTSSSWNKLELHLDSVDTSSYLEVNDNSGDRSAFTRHTAAESRYLWIGSPTDLDAIDAAAFIFDLVCVDTP